MDFINTRDTLIVFRYSIKLIYTSTMCGRDWHKTGSVWGSLTGQTITLGPTMELESWTDADRAAVLDLLVEAGDDAPEPEEDPKKLSASERRARHREVVRRSYHRNKVPFFFSAVLERRKETMEMAHG